MKQCHPPMHIKVMKMQSIMKPNLQRKKHLEHSREGRIQLGTEGDPDDNFPQLTSHHSFLIRFSLHSLHNAVSLFSPWLWHVLLQLSLFSSALSKNRFPTPLSVFVHLLLHPLVITYKSP
ncbi:unnamed protein product [Sphenostylis stenocarpa]|uniref:Uncharacterized protein n=1 Tax=Sphenostylis stenocarpa TaxID=92480 RepID=A0AA86SJ07_9FABA|nr:unnamed protein product [Sphenostylis stenocarpa]